MNTKWIRCAGLAGTVVAASAAWAQAELPPPAPLSPPHADKVLFLKITSDHGGMDVKPIKGAPYSGEQTTTTTQTLADGNRIVQTSTAKVYRDEQGRSRVEESLGGIGALASAEKHTMIMINDPVAGARYSLQPEGRTAQKMTTGGAVPDLDKLRDEKIALDKSQVFFSANVGGDGGAGVVTYKSDQRPDAKKTSEDLGVQTMEGLKVTGTRTTITIPAGGEGNEQPMQIVDEQWYSPELQTNIKTIHSDPRMGQTVFTVANVSRANPDASLFQVPADYQLTEGMVVRRDR